MNDVREQLVNQIAFTYGSLHAGKCADAILERFDVVEKPVVTDEALGKMVGLVHAVDAKALGARIQKNLAAAGLRIVKVEAE